MKYLLILASLLIFTASVKVKKQEGRSSYFMSSSFSSFSSSKHGDKPETHVKSMQTEEYRTKEGDQPEQIRKYGEMFSKDNDKPGLLKRKANTNVEEEEFILKSNPEETKTLNHNQEKEFFKNFNKSFENFFGGEEDLSFNPLKRLGDFESEIFGDVEKQFSGKVANLDSHLDSHGKYDKFLHEREDMLIKRAKKHKKEKNEKNDK
jgi:hypothetical protein